MEKKDVSELVHEALYMEDMKGHINEYKRMVDLQKEVEGLAEESSELTQDIGAIENFTDTDVTIQQGDTKKSVAVTSGIQVVNTMSKLYMTVTVA